MYSIGISCRKVLSGSDLNSFLGKIKIEKKVSIELDNNPNVKIAGIDAYSMNYMPLANSKYSNAIIFMHNNYIYVVTEWLSASDIGNMSKVISSIGFIEK